MTSDHLKIAFVSVDDAQDPHTWSGIPFHILGAMRKRQHAVHVMSPLTRNLQYLYKLRRRLWNRNLQIDRQPRRLASFAAQIRGALEQTSADLVFAPSSMPVAYLECPQPIVVWTDAVYDCMIDYYPGYDRRNARRSCEQEQHAMRRAAHVVYASEWAAGVARTHYPEYASKISVIPFGASMEPVAIPARNPSPPYKLLFVGVDWNRKGGSIALEATECLNRLGIPATLRVVGCDPPATVRSQYLEPHGFVSKRTPEGRARLHELFLSSDLLLLPTRAEAAGIVFCEASAYGLPIVTTDTGGVGTYVVDGRNGVTLPLDATGVQYAQVIAEILCSPGMYNRLSCGARREYETRLNWDVGVQTLLGLLLPSCAETRSSERHYQNET